MSPLVFASTSSRIIAVTLRGVVGTRHAWTVRLNSADNNLHWCQANFITGVIILRLFIVQ